MEVSGVAGSITALSAVTAKTKELKDKTDELSNTQKKLEEVNKELKKELEFNEKLAKHNLVADEGSKIHQKGKDQIKTSGNFKKNNPLSQVEINEIASSLAQSGIKGKDIVAYTENIKTTTVEKVK